MSASMGKASRALQRLQSRREKTARDLLEAARRVIALKGYQKTKIIDIAREAGVGVGTFYLYYPTKQAILLQLVEDTCQELKAEMDALHERVREPDTVIRERIATFLRFAQDNRELFRIVFGHGPDVHEVVKRAQETLRAGHGRQTSRRECVPACSASTGPTLSRTPSLASACRSFPGGSATRRSPPRR